MKHIKIFLLGFISLLTISTICAGLFTAIYMIITKISLYADAYSAFDIVGTIAGSIILVVLTYMMGHLVYTEYAKRKENKKKYEND